MPRTRKVASSVSWPLLLISVEEAEGNMLRTIVKLQDVVEDVRAGELEGRRAFRSLDEKILGEVQAGKPCSSHLLKG